MAIQPVRDLGGLGQLSRTLLQKRALEQRDEAQALRRQVAEGQLAAQEEARAQAAQRSALGRDLAGLLAPPADGVGPPVPPAVLGQRGADLISQAPAGGLAELSQFLKIADPTRAQKISPLQRGQGAIVDVGGTKKFVTPVFDPGTGKQVIQVTDIPGTLVSREGETPAEKAARAVSTAGDTAQVVADVELATKGPIAGSVEAAKLAEKLKTEPEITKATKLAEEAAGAATEAVATVGKIRGNIQNYENAKKAVLAGAKTGAITRLFPSFRTSSIELENTQKRLGLDIIGSVTFGALSEGELNLALETALPTSLKGPALVEWIDKKKAAQIKMSNILQEAAVFLSQPGNTQADWLELNAAATEVGEENPVTGIKFLGFEGQ